MIVNDGKLKLLNSQLTYLGGLFWWLFTSNTTILNTTVLSDLTQAGWTGYSHQAAGTWNAPTLISNKAVSTAASVPTFSNTSGTTQTFYGYALVDESATKLIAAVNLGATTLVNGATYPLVPSISDDEA